jgi:N6-L-threonylcarbamoyladenine synthase
MTSSTSSTPTTKTKTKPRIKPKTMTSPPLKILGIETSCDETSAAVVEGGRWVRSNVVASQVPLHARYGGVVPELASRAHIVDIIPVVERALAEANVSLADLDGVAVTQGPGLVGSLLVGVELAKAVALRYDLPLVGVNHVEAHLMAPLIAADEGMERPTLPFVGLVVSGGHTSLIRADAVSAYTILGQTLDDAAGEALDKAGKMLGLGYPGGVKIDHLSDGGDPSAVALPRALRRRDSLDFSFSGLKTAVRTYLESQPASPQGQALADICASVQEAVVEVLVDKTLRAAKAQGVEWVIISGGVSANRRLRARIQEAAAAQGLRASIPPRPLCTDNGAMIAGLGYHYLTRAIAAHAPARLGFAAAAMNARASWPVGAP